MSVRPLGIALCLLLAIGSQQLSTCAGWATSAQARMDCCERNAECDGPALADACCAAGEQDDSAQIAFVAIAPPDRGKAWVRSVVDALARYPVTVLTLTSSSPSNLRNAVLLI